MRRQMTTMGVYLDFSSLYQKPRDDGQEVAVPKEDVL